MSSFRTGDTVYHRPSGETWLVAFADEHDLLPAGWPCTIANPSDCELRKAASDEAHLDFVREVAAMSDQNDPRSSRCRTLLQSLGGAV
jgi:hypothetical protein